MPYLSLNPATGILAESFPSLDAAALDERLAQAAAAQREWAQTDFARRADILRDVAIHLRVHRDDYARLITSEMGKLLREARAEVEKCANGCEFYAQHAERFLARDFVVSDAGKSYVVYQPLGVLLAIMPWNFPFWQVFRAAVPALMAGNAVVLKHASSTPRCALAIERIFGQSGLPAGVFATVLAEADQIAQAIASPHVHAVTLTGSEAAGRQVAALAGQHLKKVVLELGGSDPFIVLADADLEFTVKMALASRLQNCGQSCIAAKRFIVVPEIADAFVAAFKTEVEALRVGDPLDETTQLGPMARADLRDALHRQVTDSIAAGAVAVTGCAPLPGDGFYYAPSILDRVPASAPAYTEELFGPVAAILRVADEAEALAVANQTRFGLGASIWSRDVARAERLALALESGCAFVNGMVKSDPRLPFGGVKASGHGRELGEHGIREFVNAKTVWIRQVRSAPRG